MTEYGSFVIISNCLKHGHVALHLFLSKLCRFLYGKMKNLTEIIIILIVLPPSLKLGKIFINLCCHEDYFGMDVDWIFLAVSHGKHACDGIGRTVRRLARKRSLQNSYAEQVMMSTQLYKWAIVKNSCHL